MRRHHNGRCPFGCGHEADSPDCRHSHCERCMGLNAESPLWPLCLECHEKEDEIRNPAAPSGPRFGGRSSAASGAAGPVSPQEAAVDTESAAWATTNSSTWDITTPEEAVAVMAYYRATGLVPRSGKSVPPIPTAAPAPAPAPPPSEVTPAADSDRTAIAAHWGKTEAELLADAVLTARRLGATDLADFKAKRLAGKGSLPSDGSSGQYDAWTESLATMLTPWPLPATEPAPKVCEDIDCEDGRLP